MFVTFLSDFGLQDDFVGTCHGVIKRIAPEAEIIDITHGIPPQQVLQGALVLANTLPYMPVGSTWRSSTQASAAGAGRLRCGTRTGRFFVGPDNGLLIPAAERAGIDAAHELANPEYALDSISRTFHGRDLFSPAAAHLARGSRSTSSARRSTRMRCPARPTATRAAAGADHRDLLYVDAFGNIALNVTREHAVEAGIVPGTQVELELGGERFYAVAARTFADARPGDIMLYEDSYRNMSVAISGGTAGDMLHARGPVAPDQRRPPLSCSRGCASVSLCPQGRSRSGDTVPDVLFSR